MPANYWNILTTVQTSLAGITGAPSNVAIRRKLLGLKVDTTPVWVICPGRGGEQIVQETFAGRSSGGKAGVWYDYSVAVAMIYGGNELIGATALEAFMNIRETVRNTLYQVATAIAAGGFDINMEPQEVSELAAFMGTTYDVSGFLIKYRIAEQRLG
jgi:hypothetical protein